MIGAGILRERDPSTGLFYPDEFGKVHEEQFVSFGLAWRLRTNRVRVNVYNGEESCARFLVARLPFVPPFPEDLAREKEEIKHNETGLGVEGGVTRSTGVSGALEAAGVERRLQTSTGDGDGASTKAKTVSKQRKTPSKRRRSSATPTKKKRAKKQKGSRSPKIKKADKSGESEDAGDKSSGIDSAAPGASQTQIMSAKTRPRAFQSGKLPTTHTSSPSTKNTRVSVRSVRGGLSGEPSEVMTKGGVRVPQMPDSDDEAALVAAQTSVDMSHMSECSSQHAKATPGTIASCRTTRKRKASPETPNENAQSNAFKVPQVTGSKTQTAYALLQLQRLRFMSKPIPKLKRSCSVPSAITTAPISTGGAPQSLPTTTGFSAPMVTGAAPQSVPTTTGFLAPIAAGAAPQPVHTTSSFLVPMADGATPQPVQTTRGFSIPITTGATPRSMPTTTGFSAPMATGAAPQSVPSKNSFLAPMADGAAPEPVQTTRGFLAPVPTAPIGNVSLDGSSGVGFQRPLLPVTPTDGHSPATTMPTQVRHTIEATPAHRRLPSPLVGNTFPGDVVGNVQPPTAAADIPFPTASYVGTTVKPLMCPPESAASVLTQMTNAPGTRGALSSTPLMPPPVTASWAPSSTQALPTFELGSTPQILGGTGAANGTPMYKTPNMSPRHNGNVRPAAVTRSSAKLRAFPSGAARWSKPAALNGRKIKIEEGATLKSTADLTRSASTAELARSPYASVAPLARSASAAALARSAYASAAALKRSALMAELTRPASTTEFPQSAVAALARSASATDFPRPASAAALARSAYASAVAATGSVQASCDTPPPPPPPPEAQTNERTIFTEPTRRVTRSQARKTEHAQQIANEKHLDSRESEEYYQVNLARVADGGATARTGTSSTIVGMPTAPRAWPLPSRAAESTTENSNLGASTGNSNTIVAIPTAPRAWPLPPQAVESTTDSSNLGASTGAGSNLIHRAALRAWPLYAARTHPSQAAESTSSIPISRAATGADINFVHGAPNAVGMPTAPSTWALPSQAAESISEAASGADRNFVHGATHGVGIGAGGMSSHSGKHSNTIVGMPTAPRTRPHPSQAAESTTDNSNLGDSTSADSNFIRKAAPSTWPLYAAQPHLSQAAESTNSSPTSAAATGVGSNLVHGVSNLVGIGAGGMSSRSGGFPLSNAPSVDFPPPQSAATARGEP